MARKIGYLCHLRRLMADKDIGRYRGAPQTRVRPGLQGRCADASDAVWQRPLASVTLPSGASRGMLHTFGGWGWGQFANRRPPIAAGSWLISSM